MTESECLEPGVFVDSNASAVVEFAQAAIVGATGETDAVLRLYRAVRDQIIYDPYVDFADPASFRASAVLTAGRGFCVGKASVLAACARSIGVPARLGFADVRNHLTSPRLYAVMKTDVFRWHAYAELNIDACWVKATPAFNSTLCERIGLKPLEFDGRNHSLFHPFDQAGRRHMEYVRDRGSYADVPFDLLTADFSKHYPALMGGKRLAGDFSVEAVAGVDGA
jgi:transglutaminase-like putative cysteine protease